MTVEGEGGEEKKGEGKNILVGIRFDGDGRYLINWALVKIAESGDRVIVVHVSRDSEKSSIICSKKSLDSYLQVYEGFCSLKQVELVGWISHGNSIRKTLVKEAKLSAVTTVIVGISKQNAFGCPLSMAKYCAKKLSPTTCLLAVRNGKVVFQRDAKKDPLDPEVVRRPSLSSLLHRGLSTDCEVTISGSMEDRNRGISKSPEVGTFVTNKIEKSEKRIHESRIDTDDENETERSSSTEACKSDPRTVENFEINERGSQVDPSRAKEINSGSITLLIRKLPEPIPGWPLLQRRGQPERSSSTEACKSDPRTVENFEINERGSQVDPSHAKEINSGSITLLIRKLPEPIPGWPLLQRAITPNWEALRGNEARRLSVVQWAMQLPGRNLPSNAQERKIRSKDPDHFSSPTESDNLPEELEFLQQRNWSTSRWFSYEEVKSLSHGFSSDNLIGKGGCSRVYKGSLPDGRKVAIKISKLSEETWKAFLLEVDIITTLQHTHIIPLIGICVEDDNLISVYNLLAGGSLEEILHYQGNKSVLPWDVRFKVAIGVAEALDYLHNICSKPVIHRDVKSSNILLSDDYEPQLSDFGLAIWAPDNSSYVTHTDVLGTFGYLAPEYFMYGKVSSKIDVYSFGVVLLELLSGRKPISTENPKSQESLVMWAIPKLENGEIMDLVDPNLEGNFEENQMRRMVFASSLCIKRTARLRPPMNLILKLLRGDSDGESLQQIVPEESHNLDEEVYPVSDIQSHLGLALLDVDDDSTSVSSVEQNNHHTLEDYLQGRWSRSSSLD